MIHEFREETNLNQTRRTFFISILLHKKYDTENRAMKIRCRVEPFKKKSSREVEGCDWYGAQYFDERRIAENLTADLGATQNEKPPLVLNNNDAFESGSIYSCRNGPKQKNE